MDSLFKEKSERTSTFWATLSQGGKMSKRLGGINSWKLFKEKSERT